MQQRVRVVVEPAQPRAKKSAGRVVGKSFLEALGITALVFVLIVMFGIAMRGSTSVRQDTSTRPAAVEQPETWDKTISLLPGQYTSIQNRDFKKIEVRSEFPIRVLAGDCHADYTVQFDCASGAADVFITDQRSKPLFATPQANTVTVHLVEF